VAATLPPIGTDFVQHDHCLFVRSLPACMLVMRPVVPLLLCRMLRDQMGLAAIDVTMRSGADIIT